MNSVLYWNSVLLEASRRDFTKGYVNNQQPGPIPNFAGDGDRSLGDSRRGRVP